MGKLLDILLLGLNLNFEPPLNNFLKKTNVNEVVDGYFSLRKCSTSEKNFPINTMDIPSINPNY